MYRNMPKFFQMIYEYKGKEKIELRKIAFNHTIIQCTQHGAKIRDNQLSQLYGQDI